MNKKNVCFTNDNEDSSFGQGQKRYSRWRYTQCDLRWSMVKVCDGLSVMWPLYIFNPQKCMSIFQKAFQSELHPLFLLYTIRVMWLLPVGRTQVGARFSSPNWGNFSIQGIQGSMDVVVYPIPRVTGFGLDLFTHSAKRFSFCAFRAFLQRSSKVQLTKV